MDYAIVPMQGGRWVIVADGNRKLVICDSREQAERLLLRMNERGKPAGESSQETGRDNHA